MINSADNPTIESTNVAITSTIERMNSSAPACGPGTNQTAPEPFQAGLPPTSPEDLTEDACQIPQAHAQPAKLQMPEAKIPDTGGKWVRLEVKSPAWNAEKQRVVAAIRECAEKLGRAPTQFELGKMTGITRYMVQKYFVTYAQAMRECGFELVGAGVKQPTETLFEDWARVTRELGRAPKVLEYSLRSQFSVRPLMRRFGGWNAANDALLKYAKENGRESELGISAENSQQSGPAGTAACTAEFTSGLTAGSTAELNRLPYGESLNPFPMAHAPTNETGVVFAFGMLAKELGFVIQSMQTAFPDCEALRWVNGWWERLRIEIEYQSFNFVKHRHDPKGCDLIVCWEHNWPECPLEVLELRQVVKNRVI